MINDKNIQKAQEDLKQIIHDDQKLVVQLDVSTSDGEMIGSGFLYDNKGDIVTNSHVIENASKVAVKMADSTTYQGSVIGKSPDIDIALVRVDALAGKAPMRIAN
ncbi:S1C family serine protease [Fodinisporobacter ferrooxydans]|uniref:S1C family serine protease n=1 Tax=Fodinisporobacter ferrooxydans TaxID=2901836 RepID=A0ABY4CPC7_9BACL|nr:S1C family serine protease [Alicyclobacillaceae bacterium MYW30-H2]